MTRNDWTYLLGLSTLMAITRFHHFSLLPDASLAVFFLAGLWALPWGWAWFSALAVLIDYLAIRYGGVSSFCITPAYVFLLPTYGGMWLGGFLSRKKPPAVIFATLVSATLIAFLLSNLSFYAFSGYFAATEFKTYAAQVLPYLAPYLLAPLTYVALILLLRLGFKTMANLLRVTLPAP